MSNFWKNFFRGFGSITIYPTRIPFRSLTESEALEIDRQAIAGDGRRVGVDMQEVIEREGRKLKKPSPRQRSNDNSPS